MGRRKSFLDLVDEGPMEVADAADLPPTRVPVAKCARRPDNPRHENLEVEELAATIAELGQMQPAAVASRDAYLQHRPDHADAIGDAEWVVLAGNRRHAACEKASVDTFLVHVVDDQVSEIVEIGIIENIQREPLTPMREARELQQLHERYGTTREVAAKIGKTHVYVSQRVSLLNLIPELQREVDTRELKIEEARALARLDEDRQRAAYAAGPPYVNESPTPRRSAESRQAPVAASSQSEAGSGNGVSSSRAPAGAADVAEDVGNGVSNGSARSGAAINGSGVGSGVSNTEQFASAAVAAGEVGNGVSNTSVSPARRTTTLPEDPSVLVEQIDSEYTSEQRQQLLDLLQR